MPLMGPALSFRGCERNEWRLSAIVVAKGNPGPLTTNGQPVDAEALWENAKYGTAYRYLFALPMTDQAASIPYTVAGETYHVAVPAIGQSPTMAYASCNGFSSLKLMKTVKDKNSLWKVMAKKHGLPFPRADIPLWPEVDAVGPYHLLLMGGDQVYADAMWETVPRMKQWNEKSWAKGNAANLTDRMQHDLDDFYFDLYTSQWSQPEVAHMLAHIPGILMWDDHDLIDGWGSYPPERQNCKVFGGLWNSAARAFATFQQHLKPSERRPGTIGAAPADWWQLPDNQETRRGAFSFGYIIGKIAILAIDMRSQRTSEAQVIRQEHWDEIYTWVDGLEKRDDIGHLVVMSSIPVVYPSFDTVENLLGIFPGHQDLEDDLRDHWNSRPHQLERVRMVHRLFRVAKKIRTTILSGDVHLAALGVVQSLRDESGGNEMVINQLISSAIVHPGPGAIVLFALQHLFDRDEEIDRGIVGRMIQFPGSQTKFLGGRNYLSLEPDVEQRIWCNWLVEGERFAFTKVIHPL